ncbi:MAG: response regulator transcription factor [Granulosicoccus sp.]
MTRRILIIEDEASIAELLRLHLQDANNEVIHVSDGVVGLTMAVQQRWDLVLLDLGLPRCDGLDICQRVRKLHPETPIVVVTARGSEADRIQGLDMGADDYVTKPFSVSELVARINALMRRVEVLSQAPKPDIITVGDITLDMRAHTAHIGGAYVQLTAREFVLLAHFARHPGRAFKRVELLEAVWGNSHDGYFHTVNSHINRLRAKIEVDPTRPRLITTVWGVGYKLSPDAGNHRTQAGDLVTNVSTFKV